MKKFGRMFIELDGTLTDISDLEKEDYEEFLDIVRAISNVYTVLSIKGRSNINYQDLIKPKK